MQLDPTSAPGPGSTRPRPGSSGSAPPSPTPRRTSEKAARDLGRTEQLATRNVATPTELADARSALAKAQAALQIARNELAESEAMRRMSLQELDYTEIRSPIDGVVADCEVEVGEVAIAGTTNLPGALLMTILDPDRMQVRADVDETDVPLVAPRPAGPDLPPGRPADGDPRRRRAGRPPGPARSRRSSPSRRSSAIESGTGSPLRPGMTTTVEIEVRRADDALSVPIQAVVQRRRKDLPDSAALRDWLDRHPLAPGEAIVDAGARYVTTVFVADGGVARARPVDVGLSDGRRVEIRHGLGPDDRVIVGPFRTLDELKDGDPIAEIDPAETDPTP